LPDLAACPEITDRPVLAASAALTTDASPVRSAGVMNESQMVAFPAPQHLGVDSSNSPRAVPVLDISDTSSVTLPAEVPTRGYVVALAATSSGVVFAAEGVDGIEAIDFTDPSAPTAIARTTDLEANSVATDGDVVYVGGNSSGLWLLKLVTLT